MRIALVTYALHVGGMENFLFSLAEALRKRGDQVTFIITEDVGAWHERAVDGGFDVRLVRPHLLQSRHKQAQHLLPMLAEFDAILLNNSALGQAVAGEAPSKTLRIAILHNDHPDIYEVGLANLEQLDAVVCVGTKILSEAQRLGCPAGLATHIPYGVAVPVTWPQENAPPRGDRPLRIIFVGRINHPQKGVFDLPPILARARQLGANFSFEMVGDGGSDFDELRQQFVRECPEFEVIYHGRRGREETLALMSQADVLLMPSRFEGFPVTLLEALALGVVPIASRLPGITDDAVKNGENGILPEVGDIDAFAAAVVRLQDDDLRRTMSQAAWTTALARLQDSTMVERYLELLERPPRPRPGRSQLDTVGRKLFGPSWSLPVGFAKLIAAVRERRLRKSLERLLARR